MKRGLLIIGLVFTLAFLPSWAQQKEIEKTILQALDLVQKGDTQKAVVLLAEAIMMIKNAEDLSIGQMFLCTEINGYRDYIKREGNSLKSGEPLLLYIEPAGYQIKKEDNVYKIWVSQDASIVNEKGDVILQQNNWVEFKKGFTSPVVPFYITNRVTDIPPGKYTFKFTIKDKYRNSFLDHSFEFVVE
ncbi:MAG: hypothetical protein GF421_02855 [Candidatus Aminicenantes bacterium]|nr:hypothetical protein [Candidatus Aminicenantes bacterium]